MAASIKNVNALFKIAVNRILMSWGSLQVAVQNGFGGRNSGEKMEHLAIEVENVFKKGTVEAYSLADALAEYLDVEFSVVDENDDRTFLVANHICQIHKMLTEGHVEDVNRFLAGLPAVKSSDICRFTEESDSNDNAANDRECSSSLPRMQSDGGSDEYGQNPSASHSAQSCVAVNSPSDIVQATEAMDVEDVEEEGWKVVSQRR